MPKILVTGIDTPFGGVSWEFARSNKDRAKALIIYLCGQRLLTNPCDSSCQSCAERSAKSASKIKDKINEQLMEIVDGNGYTNCLKKMRVACNSFLNVLCQEPFTERKADCPIFTLRKDIKPYVYAIIDMFKIQEDEEIQQLLMACESV